MKRPENSVWNRRPSRCSGRAGALACEASGDMFLEWTTLSLSGETAGAWNVLRILFGIDDPGAWTNVSLSRW